MYAMEVQAALVPNGPAPEPCTAAGLLIGLIAIIAAANAKRTDRSSQPGRLSPL